MRKITITAAALIASCGVAMADDCYPVGNNTGLQVCDVPNMTPARPMCYDFRDEDGKSKWVCTGEIGQPVVRDRVMPSNREWRRGKWVYK